MVHKGDITTTEALPAGVQVPLSTTNGVGSKKSLHSRSKALRASSYMSCLYLNARSIKSVTKTCNKLTDLHNMVFEHNKHIIAITETWLNDTVNDCEILPMNYTPHRKDMSWPARWWNITGC